jgi:hypothetical protein
LSYPYCSLAVLCSGLLLPLLAAADPSSVQPVAPVSQETAYEADGKARAAAREVEREARELDNAARRADGVTRAAAREADRKARAAIREAESKARAEAREAERKAREAEDADRSGVNE